MVQLNRRRLKYHSFLNLEQVCDKIQKKFGVRPSSKLLAKVYKDHHVKRTKVKYYIAHADISRLTFQKRFFCCMRIAHMLMEKTPLWYFDESSSHAWDVPSHVWQSTE